MINNLNYYLFFNFFYSIKFEPGKVYNLTYEVMNIGSKKWPESSELRCVNGFNGKTISINSLDVNQKMELNLSFKSPNFEKIFYYTWRFCFEETKNEVNYFGPRINYEINCKKL